MKSDRKHIGWLRGQLPRLVRNEVIDESVAASLRAYYGESAPVAPGSGLIRAFAIVGTLLVGLGIILLFGYNWDSIPRLAKTILAFVPLMISSVLGAFALMKKVDSRAWFESTSLAMALSSGACIGLVSQVYQIDGSLNEFYLGWVWTALPLLYLFRSYAIFFLLCVITVFWAPQGLGFFASSEIVAFLAVNVSNLLFLIREQRDGEHPTLFFGYVVATCFGVFSLFGGSLSFLFPLWTTAYFSLIYLWDVKIRSAKGYPSPSATGIVAAASLVVIAFVATFEDFWSLRGSFLQINEFRDYAVVGAFAGMLIAYAWFYVDRIRCGDWLRCVMASTPVLAGLGCGLELFYGDADFLGAGLMSVFLFVASLVLMISGYRAGSVSKLNEGLLIMVGIVVLRFFDGEFSMLARGIGFVTLGAGFIVSNILILKRKERKEDA